MAEAAAPERQMKRTLTAFDLTCIGIGAIIGTGIFALIVLQSPSQTFPNTAGDAHSEFYPGMGFRGPMSFSGRSGAGPAIAISLFVAALACGFAALCYAESLPR